MPIEVESSQWTGSYDDQPMASPIVWGEFAERAALDQAAERLQSEAWFRQSIAEAETGQPGPADNEQVIMPDEDPKGAERRNLRQNFVGIGTASTSMLAAGIVIATGGAALPAVAAAAAAGGATLAAGEAAGAAVPETGTGRRPEGTEEAARSEGPALGIHAATQDLREKAEAFLQQAGAKRVWVQETPSG
ncbi:hypothetical protein [Roseicella aerolata]|uniref:Uncharacterized protein n=1 Tax=Roseicella aerolata TaxID=2883479 RepID=A0A9X1L9Y9_9PROT|nr:hypothetical protein [Roseicella aerolata]MCB4824244.1 hypothetical protein [Roseicella aerolata]